MGHFDLLKKLKEKKIERPAVEYDSGLEHIAAGFEEFLEDAKFLRIGHHSKDILLDSYRVAEKIAAQIDYDKRGVEEFCALYANHFPAGMYLAAVVNRIIKPDDVFMLEFEQPLDGIGLYLPHGVVQASGKAGHMLGFGMLGGKVVVDKDAYGTVASYMKGGSIYVGGACGIYEDSGIGTRMEGGLVKVYGKCTCDIGRRMSGGKLHLSGDVQGYVGKEMSGGEIRIDGDIIGSYLYSSGEEKTGGRIILQGKPWR